MKNTKEIVYISVLSSVALVLSYIESLFPIPFPIPGLKLGFANIAILFAMVIFNFKSAIIVAILKSLLSSFILSRTSALLYSFSATIVSTLIMGFVLFHINKNKRYFSEIGVSVLGSVSFNIVQLLVASFVINDITILTLIPYMNLLSIVTGIFVGYTVIKLAKIFKNNNINEA